MENFFVILMLILFENHQIFIMDHQLGKPIQSLHVFILFSYPSICPVNHLMKEIITVLIVNMLLLPLCSVGIEAYFILTFAHCCLHNLLLLILIDFELFLNLNVSLNNDSSS